MIKLGHRSIGTSPMTPYVFLGDDNAESRAIPSSRPPLRSDKAFAIGYRIVS